MRALPSLASGIEELRLLLNASKSPCRNRTVRASRKAVAHEPFPGPPVRWRSARGRCYSSGRSKTTRGLRAKHWNKSTRPAPFGRELACKLDALCLRGSSLAGSRCVEQTRAMNTVPSFQAQNAMRGLLSEHVVTVVRGTAQASNPSIERTAHSQLRCLRSAAHVER
jgi:hypothetical protein